MCPEQGKMPRALFLCLTIVAVFPLQLAAAPAISEDAPVTADVAAAARQVGLDPSQDRGRFVAELARLLYTPPNGRSPAIDVLVRAERPIAPAAQGSAAIRVPVPLSTDVWARAILKRSLRPDQLLTSILADRRAALLCYALAALDDETLTYLADHPAILGFLYEQGAPGFAAFGPTLRIRDDKIDPPGGAAAVPLWEAAVGQPVDRPERFLRALYGQFEARLAYLYDTIANLDEPSTRFALGLWLPEPIRIERFAALALHIVAGYREWQLGALPFSKPLHDFGMVLMRLQVEPSGAPRGPATRAFWNMVFGSGDLSPDEAEAQAALRQTGPGDLIDAEALVVAVNNSDMYWRGDRLDQLAFGQRVFGGISESQARDALVALRALPRQRMLALTLERMGITSPQVYAAVAERANRIPTGNPNRAFWTLAQLQSIHGLLARMTIAGTIETSAAEKLVVSLYNVTMQDGEYAGGMVEWLKRELLPLIERGEDAEDALIMALAGPSPGAAAPRLAWEGERYRLDLAFAERQRLKAVRRKQAGYSVDAAFEIHAAARFLQADALTLEQAHAVTLALTTLLDRASSRLSPAGDVRPVGVDPPRSASAAIGRTLEELERAVRTRDLRRAHRAADPLIEVVDHVLGEALLSLAYAADLGDPEGAAMLARNAAVRHDFGFSRRDAEVRSRILWAVPRQDFLPGIPWHVSGSVLGLDIALGSLALRRISIDRLAEAPRLPSNERDAFAVSLAMMNPRLLRDADRTAIAEAVRRGRTRVLALASGREALDRVAELLMMDGWRRRAIRWMITNRSGDIASMFSLVELLQLGGGAATVNLDAWGMSALIAQGCACTRFETPRRWRLLGGRPQVALLASAVPDLNLHVAIKLDEMRLPAALARPVLAAAVQEFIEEVAPNDPNDWWNVVRGVIALTRERIEDFVAAAAAVDGPLVPDKPSAALVP
jgi:hypothetical protein